MILAICGLVLAQDGEPEAAIGFWERCEVDPDDLGSQFCHAAQCAVRGDAAPARAAALQWETATSVNRDAQWTWYLAEILSLAGEHARAFEVLTRAVELGFWNVTMLDGRDATLRPLMADPRYPALVEQARRGAARLRESLAGHDRQPATT